MLRLLLASLALACSPACAPEPEPEPEAAAHPFFVARPEHRELVLSRLEREPYVTLYERLVEQADRDYREDPPDDGLWDRHAAADNAVTAQACAMLAWLHEDEARARKAAQWLVSMPTDWENHDDWDVNIRMPRPLMASVGAWDFLRATPWLSDEEAAEARRRLTVITSKFFDAYLGPEGLSGLLLLPAQNNHPLRTAAAIGAVALAFPEHPSSAEWLGWAMSEVGYLYGPDGRYLQPDGGVSEGPFYFGFGWGATAALLIAWDNRYGPGRAEPPALVQDCRNRNDGDPWTGHGCEPGAPLDFGDPLRTELMHAAVEWSLALRLPWGPRPPLADAYFNPFNGGALLTSFGGGAHAQWDWQEQRDRPLETGHGFELTAHHLVYLDDAADAGPPPWTTRFYPEGGNAVFRSGWDEDARWGLLVAEAGAARKTLHDHVDGTSFTLAAYGEYLLIDPGYYKPDELNNAETAQSPSHNLVLVDGRAAPDKGLLTDFGDADASLHEWLDGESLDYAEAHQDTGTARVERSVLFVRDRWFALVDRVAPRDGLPHEQRFRLHGGAGLDLGGRFEPGEQGARWEQERAGVDVWVASTAGPPEILTPERVDFAAPHVHQFDTDRTIGHHAVMDARVVAADQAFCSVLAPYRVAGGPGEGPAEVVALPLPAGWAGWEVRMGGATDVLVVRDPGAVEEVLLPGDRTLRLDGEFALLTTAGAPALAVLGRGTELRLDGELLARAQEGEPVVLPR